jgi:hypothetical protein
VKGRHMLIEKPALGPEVSEEVVPTLEHGEGRDTTRVAGGRQHGKQKRPYLIVRQSHNQS